MPRPPRSPRERPETKGGRGRFSIPENASPAWLVGLEGELAKYNATRMFSIHELYFAMPLDSAGIIETSVSARQRGKMYILSVPKDREKPDGASVQLCLGAKNLRFAKGDELLEVEGERVKDHLTKKFPGIYNFEESSGLNAGGNLLSKVDNLMSRVRGAIKLAQKGKQRTLEEVFNAFDSDGNGLIEKTEFFLGFNDLDIKITRSEIEMIWPMLDRDSSGSLDLGEFVTFASQGSALRKDFKQLRNQRHTIVNNVVGKGRSRRIKANSDLQDLLHLTVKQLRAAVEESGKTSREWFGIFDGDGSGDIQQDELLAGLKNCGVGISEEQVELIWPVLTAERYISLEDWERYLTTTKFDIRTVRKRLNRRMMKDGKDVQELIDKVDAVTRRNLPNLDSRSSPATRKKQKKIAQVQAPPKRLPQRTFNHRKLKTQLDMDSLSKTIASTDADRPRASSSSAAPKVHRPHTAPASLQFKRTISNFDRKDTKLKPLPVDPSAPVVTETTPRPKPYRSATSKRKIFPRGKQPHANGTIAKRTFVRQPVGYKPSTAFIARARTITESVLLGKGIPKLPDRKRQQLPPCMNRDQSREQILQNRFAAMRQPSTTKIKATTPIFVGFQSNLNWGCVPLFVPNQLSAQKRKKKKKFLPHEWAE